MVVRNVIISDAPEMLVILPASRALRKFIDFENGVSAGYKNITDKGDITRRANKLVIEADSKAQLRFPLFFFLLQASEESFHHDLVGMHTVYTAGAPCEFDRRRMHLA